LKFYGIRWDYAPDDPTYFVLLDHLEEKDIDVLFEHTRKHRKRITEKETVTIERRSRSRSREPQLAWVKRRSVSVADRSPRRGVSAHSAIRLV